MSFRSETECLQAQEQLLGTERIQASTQVSENLHTYTDRESDGTKRVVKLQAVVAFRRVVELREAFSMLAPIELAAVNDDTTDCGSVTADPENTDVSTVLPKSP